ncbi:RES domain-containing protein [Geminicoccaceae bacterium 1502E]|nr:RES domain-containing protein [Geminicoccaceae bacterium 1502E]
MSLPTGRQQGLVYRGHNPRWSHAPESGEGARRHGGRFNPPGSAALYTSLRPETAWLEAQQGFPFKPQPLTLCAYEVDCTDIVDLTDMAVLAILETDAASLACGWEDLAGRGLVPPSWALAERLRAQRVAGIRVRSFAPGADPARDLNLVLWRWSRELPHRVQVIDDAGRLPIDDLSWR